MSQFVRSQVLGQDKSGFSTIIQPSASFNLDVANNVATLDFYQVMKYPFTNSNDVTIRGYKTDSECYQKYSSDIAALRSCIEDSWRESSRVHSSGENNLFLWGIDLKGSSSNGVAVIVNSEKVASSGQVSLTIGHQWSRKKYDYASASQYAASLIEFTQKGKSNQEKKLITAIDVEIKNLVDNKILEPKLTKSLVRFKSTDKEFKVDNLKETKLILLERINKDQIKIDYDNIDSQMKALDNVGILLDRGKIEATTYKTEKGNNDNNKIVNALTALRDTEKRIVNLLDSEPLKMLKISDKVKKETPVSDIRNRKEWQITKDEIILKLEDLAVDKKTKKTRLDNFKASYAENLLNAYENYILYLEKEPVQNGYEELVSKSLHYNRHIVYFKSSFLANSFKLDQGDSINTITERFKDQNEQGYKLDVGYTGQFKTYNYIGLNVALSGTNNLSALTNTTYKTQVVDTTLTPNLITNSEFKALSGPFDRFIQYEFNMDYVRLLPLVNNTGTLKENDKEKGSLLLSLNPYVRHRFYDRSETLKPNTSIGFGTYAFNTASGSIAGGVFIQADDVFNVNRDRPINFTKQISFGVVFKAAIKSFNPVKK